MRNSETLDGLSPVERLGIVLLVTALALFGGRAVSPAQPATAQQPQPEQTDQQDGTRQIIVERDLVYATHDGVDLHGDVYRPEGPGPFPGVLMVHGGGWRAGDEDVYEPWGRFLAQHGFVAFAVTYRLAPTTPPSPETSTYPENIWDLKAAVQYLRGQQDAWQVDPERIAAIGSSAGGHLVAMLGLTGDDERYANPYDDAYADLDDDVNVIVPVYGVMDLVEQWESDQQRRPYNHITEWYLGGSFVDGRVRADFYEASPIYHVTDQATEGTSWLIVWGTEDTVVTPEAQSERFVEHLTRTGPGVTVRQVPLVGEEHFWMTDNTPIDMPHGGKAYLAPRLLQFLTDQLMGD